MLTKRLQFPHRPLDFTILHRGRCNFDCRFFIPVKTSVHPSVLFSDVFPEGGGECWDEDYTFRERLHGRVDAHEKTTIP